MRPERRVPGQRPAPVPEALAGAEFRYADARAAGVTKDRLRGRSYRRLHRGVYVERRRPDDDELRIRAWMLALPADAALYGATAAVWYGLPVAAPPLVQVIVPPGTVPRRRPGLEPHEGLAADDVTVHRGVRVTTPERTWLDLSLTLGDADLVIAGDAMVRQGLTTPQRLVEAADVAWRRRRIVRARSLARLVRSRVDSPQETRLRLILTGHGGLPEPLINPDVADEHGGWIGRPDLAYVDARVAIQYEGDVHRTKKRWRSDIARDEVMRDHGWEVIRVTADDLSHRGRLCDRIRRAIARPRRSSRS
ncbi:type IV toxin-antitoxin system AbiEi family antitoxin [Jiangella anatolica]|uniref:AbiEi antitoxin C-terminal domain-containing protein n=1 Tax=Jiangella anatolica TaxID=2670374 RepID=A0A2W2BV10_9ACTN|nr:type IV toxin-antitoxin system AbiEi family antitoxin [Jiangella anatolica]PZF83798.1 hypothetical protein C1I92_10925 [Jiangella anatolica]